MKIISIMNLKGGVGKTVTAINMAAILSRDYQAPVLLVDADSQGNLSEFVRAGLPEKACRNEGGLADLLRGVDGTIRATAIEGADLLPATDDLMELDVSTVRSGKSDPMHLVDFLTDCDADYAYCIIDCPPAFNAAATAALVAADEVLIPMKLDAFGLRGMTNLLAQVKNMQKVNPGLEVAGILPTMYYKTTQMDYAEKLLRESGLPVYSHIRRSTKVDEMTFAQLPIIKSSPKSGACRDYRRFVAEWLRGGEQNAV